jgi:ABC-type glycerol-3-phosphate transport system permease component
MARRRAWLAAILGAAALLNLAPFLYQVGLSLASSERIFSSPWPFMGFTLDHYRYVLEKLPMWRYAWNTLVFALGVSLGHLLLSLLAAYAFVRYRFPLQEALFALFLVSLMVPFVVTYLPSYLLVAKMGLLNTFPGLILPMLTAGYGVFLLRQHFRHFPREILEAALVDGADGFALLFRILAPASLPTLVPLPRHLPAQPLQVGHHLSRPAPPLQQGVPQPPAPTGTPLQMRHRVHPPRLPPGPGHPPRFPLPRPGVGGRQGKSKPALV